jgi:hypothetical protein
MGADPLAVQVAHVQRRRRLSTSLAFEIFAHDIDSRLR